MKYLFLFESYKKSESILKKFSKKLTNSQLDFIEYIKSNVLPGYIGKLVVLYVKDIVYYDYDSSDDIKWIIDNIKDTKLNKPIDSYSSIKDIIYAIKLSKTIKLLNKIRKNNSIKYNLDIEKLAGIVIRNDLDLSKIVKLPVHGKVNSDEDFINLISNSFIENMNKHKDWNILYEDNDLLIYEILSYEGALYLSHVNQCIRSENMYNSYKGNGFRFNPTDGNVVGKAITTMSGSRMDDNYIKESIKLKQIGSIYNSNSVGGRIYDSNNISCTLTSQGGGVGAKTGLYKMEDHRIRKLTPLECFRLQGFPDDFVKPVSNSQLYKQTGNSISVPVVENILKILLKKYIN